MRFSQFSNARNVGLYYPYWQYTDLFIFRFVIKMYICIKIYCTAAQFFFLTVWNGNERYVNSDLHNKGITIYIGQHINCKSKNVIYLVTCNKCSLQCVGSTSTELKVRFRNDKSSITTTKTRLKRYTLQCKRSYCWKMLNSLGSNILKTTGREIGLTKSGCLVTREAYRSAIYILSVL